jgi:hypothetical protein
LTAGMRGTLRLNRFGVETAVFVKAVERNRVHLAFDQECAQDFVQAVATATKGLAPIDAAA